MEGRGLPVFYWGLLLWMSHAAAAAAAAAAAPANPLSIPAGFLEGLLLPGEGAAATAAAAAAARNPLYSVFAVTALINSRHFIGPQLLFR